MTRSSTVGKSRILIADDNEATRYMFRLITECDFEVVGEAESGEDASRQLKTYVPTCLS